MEVYAGLDVSLERTEICVLDGVSCLGSGGFLERRSPSMAISA